MAYDSNGKWNYEDDSTASRVAAITAGGSPLMQQAATAGMQAANRRGLGNSSMAAGASQQAVIAAATPIASQDAQQTAQKNALEMQNRQQTSMATMEDSRARDLSAAELASRKSLADMEDARVRQLQADQLKQQMGIATMEDTRSRELNTQNLTAQREQQTADIAFKTGLAGQEDARIRQLQADQLKADAEKTRQTLAAEQQKQIASSLADMSAQRFNATANTLNNEKIPADVRAAAQASINQQYDSTLNYLSNLYGVKLSNSTPTAAPAAAVPTYAGYGGVYA